MPGAGRRFLRQMSVAGSLLALAFQAQAEDWASVGQALVTDHLEVGLRSVYYELRDKGQRIFNGEEFLGGYTYGISIDRLEERRNYDPQPYLRIKPIPYLAFELGWERLEAATRTYWDNHSDGNVNLSGPSVAIIARLPNETIFTPYAGLGRVYFTASFDHWTDFYDAGRTIEVDNTVGNFYLVGCEVTVYDGLQADLMYRSMTAKVDSLFYIDDPPRDGQDLYNMHGWTFPFDNWSVLLGVKWAF